MNFATTAGERTPEALAARIFGIKEDDPAAKRAANALVRANPLLRRIEELPPTVVSVPDVRGLEPVSGITSLAAAATSLLLGAALEHIDEVAGTAAELAKENVAAARAFRKDLEASDLKRRARADKGFAAWLKEAELEALAHLEEARALAKAQKAAIGELADDLEAMLDVLGKAASGRGRR
jgi:hypothetical protein